MSLLPDRFTEGDFSCWLRPFKLCTLNSIWAEATKLLKLPAFLQLPGTGTMLPSPKMNVTLPTIWLLASQRILRRL